MPDTAAYYRAAYIVVAVLYTAYTASIWLRARRVRARLKALAAGGDPSGPRSLR